MNCWILSCFAFLKTSWVHLCRCERCTPSFNVHSGKKKANAPQRLPSKPPSPALTFLLHWLHVFYFRVKVKQISALHTFPLAPGSVRWSPQTQFLNPDSLTTLSWDFTSCPGSVTRFLPGWLQTAASCLFYFFSSSFHLFPDLTCTAAAGGFFFLFFILQLHLFSFFSCHVNGSRPDVQRLVRAFCFFLINNPNFWFEWM